MCLQTSSIRPYQKWNWNGSEIVYKTAIPTTRKLTKNKRTIYRFPVDIRQFITIENNAVVKDVIKDIIKHLSKKEQLKFLENKPTNFDFRVRQCQEYLNKMHYIDAKTRYDQWQFPEETIRLKSGDCEDFAFLLASLILSSGISDYCVRVAFGNVIQYDGEKEINNWEHTWVMYQNEQGVWEIIEPLLFVQHEQQKMPAVFETDKSFTPQDYEYMPHYVFNRNHLWRVRTWEKKNAKEFDDYLMSERKYFNKFNPGFAAGVHNTIFHAALKGMSWFDLQKVMATSLYIDVNTLAYDPRDHFDFAYIDEGWERVNDRLAQKSLEEFALAIHAISDFYAHSFYGYFAIDANGNIPVYDPSNPMSTANLSYDFSKLGDLPGCKLNECSPGAANAEAVWNGQLISGQWYRWYASIPDDIQYRADFCTRRCLPDHDAVAVDSEKYKSKHKLFDAATYQVQYKARVQAAITHISQVYEVWKADQ